MITRTAALDPRRYSTRPGFKVYPGRFNPIPILLVLLIAAGLIVGGR